MNTEASILNRLNGLKAKPSSQKIKDNAIEGLTTILKSRQEIKDIFKKFLEDEKEFLNRLDTRTPFGAVESVTINGRISKIKHELLKLNEL